LYETGYLRIIVPAAISIGILIHFQYFHVHFMKKLNIEPQTTSFDNNEHIQIDLETNTWSSRIRKTTILVFHVHFNKLEIILFVILIMNKVSPAIYNNY